MCEDYHGYGHGMRNFLTKEERIDILKQYKESLENEAKGVAERIKELQKNN
jgi:negative regulator of sigma E activity